MKKDNVCSVLPPALIALALSEDIGDGDVTVQSCVPQGARMTAQIVARTPVVVAGFPFVHQIIGQAGADISLTVHPTEGESVAAGSILAVLTGSARDILTYERVILNMLYVTCGIATTTRRYVDALRGSPTKLLDTRKTWPALRAVSKYASLMGGAFNHRMGLYDAVMIKDNHRAYINDDRALVRDIRLTHPDLPIIFECDTMDQVDQALTAGVDHILLDNMTPPQVRAAVIHIAGRAVTEASGGITLDTIALYGQTGVDYVSTSIITMTPDAIDLGLDVF